MSDQRAPAWLAGAARLNGSGGRNDGDGVAGSLFHGLRVLREAFYLRIRQDVERVIGKDSFLMPVSEMQTRRRTPREIEAFQVPESVAAARQSGYLGERADWYLLWLLRLRLGEQPAGPHVLERCLDYASRSDDQRRLEFSDALVRILPESRKAPLVLFRLYPLALRIVTAGALRTAIRLPCCGTNSRPFCPRFSRAGCVTAGFCRAMNRAADAATRSGNTSGSRRSTKVGDAVRKQRQTLGSRHGDTRANVSRSDVTMVARYTGEARIEAGMCEFVA